MLWQTGLVRHLMSPNGHHPQRKEELKQQRKDQRQEDENAKEVGYLFDQAQSPQLEKRGGD